MRRDKRMLELIRGYRRDLYRETRGKGASRFLAFGYAYFASRPLPFARGGTFKGDAPMVIVGEHGPEGTRLA